MRTSRLAIAALAALLLPALATAQVPGGPPGEAHALLVDGQTLTYWVGPSWDTVDEELGPGENASLWFALLPNKELNLTVYLNVSTTSENVSFTAPSLTLGTLANGSVAVDEVAFSITTEATGVSEVRYTFIGEIYSVDNDTYTFLGPMSAVGVFTIEIPAPAVEPAFPVGVVVAGVAIATVVVGGYALRQRSVRRRMNEGPRRSQVMRELELEKKIEKAKAPEQVAEIRQEIRQAEQVREKRRELQILEAKRADALKTIELLKKRHEAGGLSRHQFDNMAAKKNADLERIEAEIAEMEREDAGSAA